MGVEDGNLHVGRACVDWHGHCRFRAGHGLQPVLGCAGRAGDGAGYRHGYRGVYVLRVSVYEEPIQAGVDRAGDRDNRWDGARDVQHGDPHRVDSSCDLAGKLAGGGLRDSAGCGWYALDSRDYAGDRRLWTCCRQCGRNRRAGGTTAGGAREDRLPGLAGEHDGSHGQGICDWVGGADIAGADGDLR